MNNNTTTGPPPPTTTVVPSTPNCNISEMSNPNSEVSGFAISSNSLLFEPLDIKKLFSSYTYESPILDSNEDFCISPKFDEEKGLYVEDSEIEEEGIFVNSRMNRKEQQSEIVDMGTENRDFLQKSNEEARKNDIVPGVEVPAYSDSLLLTSEPPDIANLFSSYAYESPELDSADFESSLLRDYEKGEGEDSVPPTAAKMVDGLSCFTKNISDSYAKSARSTKAENNQDHSAARVVEELSCFAKNLSDTCAKSAGPKAENNPNHSAAQIHGPGKSNLSSQNCMDSSTISDFRTQEAAVDLFSNISNKPAVCSRPEADDIDTDVRPKITESLIPSAKASDLFKINEACDGKMEKKSKVNEDDSGWIMLNHESREVYCKSSKKDDKQFVCTESGFKSVANEASSKMNDENSPANLTRKSKVDRSSRSGPKDRKVCMVTREVFKDSTNFHHSPVLESSGKWMCPQKNKPNRGPPLKQLRLERWFDQK